jgi:hypothetical protein
MCAVMAYSYALYVLTGIDVCFGKISLMREANRG